MLFLLPGMWSASFLEQTWWKYNVFLFLHHFVLWSFLFYVKLSVLVQLQRLLVVAEMSCASWCCYKVITLHHAAKIIFLFKKQKYFEVFFIKSAFLSNFFAFTNYFAMVTVVYTLLYISREDYLKATWQYKERSKTLEFLN